MNCFRWDMSCVQPQQQANCSPAVWFWVLAGAVAFYALTGKKGGK